MSIRLRGQVRAFATLLLIAAAALAGQAGHRWS
jgi:hypothetical protein